MKLHTRRIALVITTIIVLIIATIALVEVHWTRVSINKTALWIQLRNILENSNSWNFLSSTSYCNCSLVLINNGTRVRFSINATGNVMIAKFTHANTLGILEYLHYKNFKIQINSSRKIPSFVTKVISSMSREYRNLEAMYYDVYNNGTLKVYGKLRTGMHYEVIFVLNGDDRNYVRTLFCSSCIDKAVHVLANATVRLLMYLFNNNIALVGGKHGSICYLMKGKIDIGRLLNNSELRDYIDIINKYYYNIDNIRFGGVLEMLNILRKHGVNMLYMTVEICARQNKLSGIYAKISGTGRYASLYATVGYSIVNMSKSIPSYMISLMNNITKGAVLVHLNVSKVFKKTRAEIDLLHVHATLLRNSCPLVRVLSVFSSFYMLYDMLNLS